MDNLTIPNHVAIILDGNGRWAKEKGKNRSFGHLKGFNNLKQLAKYIFKKRVKILSVYAFSTENFNRSKEEVDFLMNLFVKKFYELKDLKDVKIVFSGIKDTPLPKDIITITKKLEQETEQNKKYIFNICINYGGQSEIIDSCKKLCQDVIDKKININSINKDLFNSYLYNDLPPIDLLIRTGGEFRISNFMLWQSSYAEFYFTKVYFPDFNKEEFDKAIIEFNKRERRFGSINEKK